MREPLKMIDFHCATFTHVVKGSVIAEITNDFSSRGRVSSRILIAFNKSLLFEDINNVKSFIVAWD